MLLDTRGCCQSKVALFNTGMNQPMSNSLNQAGEQWRRTSGPSAWDCSSEL